MTEPIASITSQNPPPPASDTSVDRALGRRLFLGLLVGFLLIFVVGGWAATAELSGAVIAPSQVVVDSNVKKVQHPTGGVVGEIHVRSGDVVEAGALLIQLDATQAKSALGIVASRILELEGRKIRLMAERDGVSDMSVPETFTALGPEAERVAQGELRLFNARIDMRRSQIGQLRERVGQLRREIEGLTAQRDAKAGELELVSIERDRVADMFERKLTPVTRLLAIKRDVTRIAGEHGALISQIARAEGQITETELQIVTLDQNARSEAQKELRDIETRLAELFERRIAAEDQLKRIDIRAPIAGTIHEMVVHTQGGVINPAETLMLIVPSGDLLTIEARIAPPDIDDVTVGTKAMLRFPAFNQRITPEIPGEVARVSADLSRDLQSGATYYVARIRVEDEDLAMLGDVQLVPGMPVEAFVQTQQRTALSYFLKPFTDQFARAFREQ